MSSENVGAYYPLMDTHGIEFKLFHFGWHQYKKGSALYWRDFLNCGNPDAHDYISNFSQVPTTVMKSHVILPMANILLVL